MDKFKLAMTMIVKDCAKELARCLESAKNYYDVVSITDTGSSDDTIEVAKQYNAILTHYKVPKDWKYEFIDNFSKARNIAEKAVPTDCQFSGFIDSDDELIGGDLLRELVLKHTKGEHSFIVGYANDDFTPNRRRVWSRGHFYWIGRIHEGIIPINTNYEEHEVYRNKEIYLYHHKSEELRSHSFRDLTLLKIDYDETPNVDTAYQLACHLFVEDKTRLNEAISLFESIIQEYPLAQKRVSQSIYKLAVISYHLKDYQNCIDFCQNFLSRDKTFAQDENRLINSNVLLLLSRSFLSINDLERSNFYFNQIPFRLRKKLSFKPINA